MSIFYYDGETQQWRDGIGRGHKLNETEERYARSFDDIKFKQNKDKTLPFRLPPPPVLKNEGFLGNN